MSVDLLNSHVLIDGQFVSAKIERLVQAIKDYEPELEVKWVPPAQRTEGMAAYAIEHHAPGNAPYVLMYVQNDEEFDERVLMRIIQNDQRNGQARLSDLEAWEATLKSIERQKFLDSMEEANDIAHHVFRTHLNTYRVNKDLIIKE